MITTTLIKSKEAGQINDLTRRRGELIKAASVIPQTLIAKYTQVYREESALSILQAEIGILTDQSALATVGLIKCDTMI